MPSFVENDHEPLLHCRTRNDIGEEIQEDIESHDSDKYSVMIDGHGAHNLHLASKQVVLHIREPDSSGLHRTDIPGAFMYGERHDFAGLQEFGSRMVVGDNHDAILKGNEARTQFARISNHRDHHVGSVAHEPYVVSVFRTGRVGALFEKNLYGENAFICDIGLKKLNLRI